MTIRKKSTSTACQDTPRGHAPRGVKGDTPDASETGYLLQNPANAARLRESLRQLADGKALHRPLPEA